MLPLVELEDETGAAADERALIAAAVGGDCRALTGLIRATVDELRVYIAARAPQWDLVDDVLQTTYVTALAKLASFRPDTALVAWLKGIARLHLLETCRRVQSESGRRYHNLKAILAHRAAAQLDGDVVEDGEEAAALRACLAALGPRAREMLHRRHVDDIPLKKLAQQFKQSREAIAGVLKRTRQALRQCLRDKGVKG